MLLVELFSRPVPSPRQEAGFEYYFLDICLIATLPLYASSEPVLSQVNAIRKDFQ